LIALGLVMVAATACARPSAPPAKAGLTSAHPCTAGEVGDSTAPQGDVFEGPDGLRFTCSTLTVPVDQGLTPGSRVPGQLDLQVAASVNPHPARGVLVWLVGGPGEPGSRMAAEIAGQFDRAVLADYQLVLLSGRGTGTNALQCPWLQQAMGSADLIAPPPASIDDCAARLGDARRFYSTASSVADLDMLRRALGADKLTLDGASYGSFLAAHYTLAHPDHVQGVILDSVVPFDGFDPMDVTAFGRAATVLRAVCARLGCPADPAEDLARVVAARHDGLDLLELLTARTGGAPRLDDLPGVLHDAAAGSPAGLDALIAAERSRHGAEPDELSQGLHAATECEDMRGPWGDISAPVAGRAAAVSAAAAALTPTQLGPFDAATAAGNGPVVTCERWPVTAVPPLPPVSAHLPPVPTLILAGDQDIDTPLDMAQHELGLAPGARLVVVPAAGHITQDVAQPPQGRQAVTEFLTGSPAGAAGTGR
jgi:pimeloyl-ACP methyl ester carboxylesterase